MTEHELIRHLKASVYAAMKTVEDGAEPLTVLSTLAASAAVDTLTFADKGRIPDVWWLSKSIERYAGQALEQGDG